MPHTTALIAVEPQHIEASDLEVEHYTDERNNPITDVYSKSNIVVNGTDYRFHAGSDYGTYTAEEYLANQVKLGNKMILTSALVLVADIGAVSYFASQTYYNQSIQVCF